jgi:CAAX protease family protein
MKNPLWNGKERRLRAGWRLLVLFVATAAASFLAYGPLARISSLSAPVVRLLYVALAFMALWAVTRWLDRRSLADLGLRRGPALSALVGFVSAALVIVALVVVTTLLGWSSLTVHTASFGRAGFWLSLAVQLVVFAVACVYEEALSRGYLIRNLAEGWNLGRDGRTRALAAAWIASSLLFALMHAGNPGAGWLSFLNLTLLGAIFALPFVVEGSLAMPIGMHFGWNVAMGPICGLAVSGEALPAALLTASPRGPELWLGGSFGPESGLGVTVAVLVLAVLVAAWLRARRPRRAPRRELAEYPA